MEREVFFVLPFGTSVQELHKMKYQNFLFMPNFALFLDIVSYIAASKKIYWSLLRNVVRQV